MSSKENTQNPTMTEGMESSSIPTHRETDIPSPDHPPSVSSVHTADPLLSSPVDSHTTLSTEEHSRELESQGTDTVSNEQLREPRLGQVDYFVSDLVSLSSESDHNEEMDFLHSDDDSHTEQTNQEARLAELSDGEGDTNNVSTHLASESNTSDEWFTVEPTVPTSECIAIPSLEGVGSNGSEGSSGPYSKTIEVLATSEYRDDTLMLNPVAHSITSLEDDENEKFVDSESATAGSRTFSEYCQGISRVSPVTPSSIDHTHSPHTQHTSHGGESMSVANTSSASPMPSDSPSQSGECPEGKYSWQRESGRLSPYLLISKTGNVAKVTEFESPGLLYAKSNTSAHNTDLLLPADEVAEDVLDVCHGEDREDDAETMEFGEDGSPKNSTEVSYEVGLDVNLCAIDPGILNDLERRALNVASNLNNVMDNLQNSLHAMSVCSKQSIQLYRESVDNLHMVVDANAKATYMFISKFEELHRSLGPLQQIASQIQEVDEKLRILEKIFMSS